MANIIKLKTVFFVAPFFFRILKKNLCQDMTYDMSVTELLYVNVRLICDIQS